MISKEFEIEAMRIAEEVFEYPEAEHASVLSRLCGENQDLLARVRAIVLADQQTHRLDTKHLGNLFRHYVASVDGQKSSTGGESNEQGIQSGFSHGAWLTEPNSLIGRQVGPYRISALIAQGGMGWVFRAERSTGDFSQEVAIKFLNHAIDPAIFRQFQVERQILADLNHPNVARLLDGGTTEDGVPYVIMEYVDGQPLTKYFDVPKNGLELKVIVGTFIRIANALDAVHRAAIIHKDVKPSNVLVDSLGEPKLLDFGIAKILDESASENSGATLVVGFTPNYASPEQIEGKSLTTATDVYSLGMCLYEVLAGERPYDLDKLSAFDARQTVLDWATRFSENVHYVDLDVPVDLGNVIRKALTIEVSRRYSGAGEFAHDLSNFLQNRPVTARTPSVSYRFRKFFMRHRWSVSAGLFALITLVVSLAVSLQQTQHARDMRTIAEQQTTRAEAVSSYLGDLLLSPSVNWDSPVQLGPNASMRDLMIAAEIHLRENLLDQPEERVKLFNKISEARSSMGDHDEAIRIQTENLAWSQANLPADAQEIEDALYYLGAAYHNDMREEGTFGYYFEVLNRAEELDLPPSIRQAYAMNDIAMAYSELGQWEEALPYQMRTLELANELDVNRDSALWVPAHYNMGYYSYQLGDLEAAKKHYEEALRVHRIQPDSTKSPGSKTRYRLARLLQLQYPNENSQLKRAATLASEALRLARELSSKGSDRESVLLAAGTLADTYVALNQNEMASQVIAETLRRYAEDRSEEAARYLYFVRSKVRLAEGDLDRARADIEMALILSAHPPELLEDVALLHQQAAAIYLALGDVSGSELSQRASENAFRRWLRP